MGGSSEDWGADIAVDSDGNAYITGYTQSSNFPAATEPVPGPDHSLNGSDAFVVKLNASGTALLYATFLGGRGDEMGRGIAIDVNGMPTLWDIPVRQISRRLREVLTASSLGITMPRTLS